MTSFPTGTTIDINLTVSVFANSSRFFFVNVQKILLSVEHVDVFRNLPEPLSKACKENEEKVRKVCCMPSSTFLPDVMARAISIPITFSAKKGSLVAYLRSLGLSDIFRRFGDSEKSIVMHLNPSIDKKNREEDEREYTKSIIGVTRSTILDHHEKCFDDAMLMLRKYVGVVIEEKEGISEDSAEDSKEKTEFVSAVRETYAKEDLPVRWGDRTVVDWSKFPDGEEAQKAVLDAISASIAAGKLDLRIDNDIYITLLAEVFPNPFNLLSERESLFVLACAPRSSLSQAEEYKVMLCVFGAYRSFFIHDNILKFGDLANPKEELIEKKMK
ncbi:MAG: hypothetical protein LBB21_00590 [Holosporaceae bacterium]|jgi:hypothetical protein|nr:hypothetical protein [Holosporaceae bacterium]